MRGRPAAGPLRLIAKLQAKGVLAHAALQECLGARLLAAPRGLPLALAVDASK
jgi:hypothetical protein